MGLLKSPLARLIRKIIFCRAGFSGGKIENPPSGKRGILARGAGNGFVGNRAPPSAEILARLSVRMERGNLARGATADRLRLAGVLNRQKADRQDCLRAREIFIF